MTRLLTCIDRLCVAMGIFAGAALTILAGFTVLKVVMRYVFNEPVRGSNDIVQLTLVVMIWLALAYAGRSNGHIVIDLVPNYPFSGLNRLRDAFAKLAIAIVFGLLAWQGWLGAEEKEMLKETSNMLGVSLYYFYYVLSVGSGLYAAALLVEFAIVLSGRPLPHLSTGLENQDSVTE